MQVASLGGGERSPAWCLIDLDLYKGRICERPSGGGGGGSDVAEV